MSFDPLMLDIPFALMALWCTERGARLIWGGLSSARSAEPIRVLMGAVGYAALYFFLPVGIIMTCYHFLGFPHWVYFTGF
jgi:hypothetical protein